MIARIKPINILKMPIVRTKRTRGLLPLQMDQRMKFGCDWPRRAAVVMVMAGRKADLEGVSMVEKERSCQERPRLKIICFGDEENGNVGDSVRVGGVLECMKTQYSISVREV